MNNKEKLKYIESNIPFTGYFYNKDIANQPISICWKCNSKLFLKKMKNGCYGLFCQKCSRFRKFNVNVPQEVEVCVWSRVDVRRSGKYKRKVYLNEII